VLNELAGCHRPQQSQPQQTPQALYDAVRLQYVHGDLPGSQSAADQAVARFAGQDPAWEWKFRFLEASIRMNQGKNAEALALLQSPLPASLANPDYAIQRYSFRGVALARLGNLGDGEKEVQQALTLSAETHSTFRAEACVAAGVVDIDLNKLAEATAALREGRQAAHARGDTFLEARMLSNLSVVALHQERYDDALDALTAATELARSMGAKAMLENTLGNTGWAYHEIGDYERARASFAEASEEAEKVGNLLDEVRWLNNLGEEQWQHADLADAEASYRKALSLAQSIHSAHETASVEMDLAWLLYDRGQYSEAAQMCDLALAGARANQNTATELDLVSLQGKLALRRGDRDEALNSFRDVETRPEALPSQRLEAQDAMAGLFADNDQVQLAEVWYRKALATFEKQDVYPHYAEFLIRHHREEEALKLVDTGRARALEEGLQLKAGSISSTGPGAGINPRALAAKLHAVLLEYSLGNKQSWLWVATPKSLELYRLPGKDDIAEQIVAYRKAILKADDVLAVRNAEGISLYNTLVAPAQSMIRSNARVIILPDGVLNELNFETLLVSKPQTHFWIDDVTVENANSLRLLDSFARHGARRRAANLLLIGDPVPPSGEFIDLQNAPQEVSAVANHFPADHRTILTRQQAFPLAYRESDPKRFTYVHFVAHGTASRLEPLESAVVLSGNPGHPQDFRLYARDIIHTPLSADLVTISTCYGSGSREYAGEGLLGLSWSFLRAGAHNVVGALWEVSDLSTPQLMNQLYSGMENGQSPHEALRAAKLTLAHSQGTFRKPFYWAAFQVYAGS